MHKAVITEQARIVFNYKQNENAKQVKFSYLVEGGSIGSDIYKLLD